MKFLAFFIMLLAFVACTDSDKYLHSSEPESIIVSAYMTPSFDSIYERGRADTITPGDSLIFLTSIYPSKSVWSQKYYWTLDGNIFANEYNFKSTVYTPGTHEIVFVFVDYFGDTLSDTLSLTVASPPTLDVQNFIPADGMQQVDPYQILHFAWNADDPDSIWNLNYHFMLYENGCDDSCKPLADTIVDRSTFSYVNGFKPLHEYSWYVRAYNEIGQESIEEIAGRFFVRGFNNESAVLGFVKTNTPVDVDSFYITLLDSGLNVVNKIEQHENTFNIGALAKGSYCLHIGLPHFPDFKTDTIRFSLLENQVLSLDTVVLNDRDVPRIASITGRDPLAPEDTLKFLVTDGGSGIDLSRTIARLDGISVNQMTLSNDTLSVPVSIPEASWTKKILVISTHDLSGNEFHKSFYVLPKTTLVEVFVD